MNDPSHTRLRSDAGGWFRVLGAPTVSSLLVATATVMPLSLRAQTWAAQVVVQANATATSNGTLAPSGDERKDLVTTVRPTFQVSGEGASFKLKALVGADLVSYARNSQPDRVSPLLRADLNARLAERLLFLDASIDVHQAELDPYAPRTESGTTQNRRIASAYRVSPYLSYEILPSSTLLARYEETVIQSDADTLPNQRFSKIQVRAERKPVPLGGSLELVKQDARLSGSSDSRWTVESFKAGGDFAISGEVIVGPVIGAERSMFFLQQHTDSLYGAHLQWTPSERTQLLAEVQHRFFGTGWNLSLRHRTPFMSFALRLNRAPVTSSTSAGVAPAGTDLSVFLDSILTTRYPDAAVRSALVSSLVSSRGLRTNLAGAVDILAEYAQLQSGASATWVLLGSRNTVSLSLYQQTLGQLARPGDVIGSLLPANADNRQTGATLDLNRKLTPQMSIDLASTWSRISGLAARLGDVTEQQTHRLAVIRTLSPHTGASAGLQYNKLRTTVVGVDSHTATAAFVGLNHRF
jgi:uncharacterized protein (PEP-CTERM system associated)